MGLTMRVGDTDDALVKVEEGSEDVLANGIEICRVGDKYEAGYEAEDGAETVLANGIGIHRGSIPVVIPEGEG
jgi:uncharacterized Zn-binding protein involved in type VI secretion